MNFIEGEKVIYVRYPEEREWGDVYAILQLNTKELFGREFVIKNVYLKYNAVRIDFGKKYGSWSVPFCAFKKTDYEIY